MNFEVFDLSITVKFGNLKSALTCIFHTIMFHRAYGKTQPVTCECDYVDVTYVRCHSPKLNEEIMQKAADFTRTISKANLLKSQVFLSFNSPRETKSFLSTKKEMVCFERWVVTVNIDSDLPGVGNEQKLRAALELSGVMTEIVHMCNSKHDHIPEIANSEEIPFWPEITEAQKSNAGSGGTWFGLFGGNSTGLI